MTPALAGKPLAALFAGAFVALVLAVANAARPSPANIHPEVQTGSEMTVLPVTHQNYPGIFTTWNRVTSWDSGANETVETADWQLRMFLDGQPRLIPAPHGPDHVVCMLPKVGSTRWKSLLFTKHGRPQDPNRKIKPHKDLMSWLKNTTTREEIVSRISEPEHLRFMWLRNPYSRLLSGFLDKGVGGNINEKYNAGMGNYGAPFTPTPSEFLRFVKALLSMRADGEKIDKHFELQAHQCGMQHGMQYDFHLKVEDIHVWYPDLVALFGLEDTVSSGWSFQPNTPDCFYPLPDKTCELTDLIISHHSEFLPVTRTHHAHMKHGSTSKFVHESKQAFLESATSKHSHSADKHIQEFYNTKEVLELATEYLREDLEQFEYPEMSWNEQQERLNN